MADQKYDPQIIKANEPDVPPGTPPYSMGAFLASGQPNVGRFVSPTPTPTVAPTQPTAPTPATSLIDRARGLVDRAATGITNLFGGAPQITVAANSAADEANARFAQRNPVDLEKGLDELEQRSTKIDAPQIVPNFYMTRITANKNMVQR